MKAARLADEAVRSADQSGDRSLQGACRLTWAAMLNERYARTGTVSDIEQAGVLLDEALELLPSGHGDVPGVHAMAGAVWCNRFRLSQDLSALHHAVHEAQLAVTSARPDDPRLPGWRSNLGTFLQLRFAETDADTDIDEAITQGRLAVHSMSGPQRALTLGALLGSLVQRVIRWQRADDIAEAMEIAREALDTTSAEFPHRLPVLANAVAALRASHQLASGGGGELGEAIPLQRELCDSFPEGYPEAGIHLISLAELLMLRWGELGERDDLDEAVRTVRRYAGLAGEAAYARHAAATRTLVLRQLSKALLAEGDQSGAEHAGAESVEAARSLRAAAKGNAVLAGRGLILEANALLAQYEATGSEAARLSAVQCLDEAADECAVGDPQRAIMVGNAALLQLNALPDDAAGTQLSPVVERLREAMELNAATGARTESWAQAAANLGVALTRRYVASSDEADLTEAVRLWDQVHRAEGAPPQQRVRTAALTGDLLMTAGDPAGASERYAQAVHLLPLAAWRGAGRPGAEAQLAAAPSVACDAAASTLEAGGKPAEALRLLEAGRGVQWARTLQLRYKATELHQWNPVLATRLQELASQLESVDDPLLTDSDDPGAASRRTDQRTLLSSEFRRLVDEAVASGHGGFLAPPQQRELLAAASQGPVVVVNISQWRCDALVVTADAVLLCPLPDLSASGVEQRTVACLGALERIETAHRELEAALQASAHRPGLASAHSERRARANLLTTLQESDEVLDGTLRWLWDVVAEPVVATLTAISAQGPAQRLWWCPTGALALLPLHAAGHHDPGNAGATPRTLLDQFTCSTTPTVLALARAHRAQPAVRSATDGRMLMVALSDASGQLPLPEVTRERDLLSSLLPEHRLTVLEGPYAAKAPVREALRTHPWAHISCHGIQFLNDPSAGGLWLHDGLLTVADISAGRHQGDFVLLSACKTATGGRGLPNEVISLSAALHFTGYRHVVGTHWSVDARAAADFCESVHTQLAADGDYNPTEAATAVRGAALRLRDDPRLPRFSWVPFTHTGP